MYSRVKLSPKFNSAIKNAKIFILKEKSVFFPLFLYFVLFSTHLRIYTQKSTSAYTICECM